MSEAARSWLINHPGQYGVLFDDGIQSLEVPLEEAALTTLLRRSNLNGLPKEQEYLLPELDYGVHNILKASRNGTFGLEHSFPSEFSAVQYSSFVERTATVVKLWERASIQQTGTTPFANLIIDDLEACDATVPETELVLTAAAAIAEVIHGLHRNHATVPKWAVKGVALFGPRFTRSFIEGQMEPLFTSDCSDFSLLSSAQRKQLLSSSPRTLGTVSQNIAMAYEQYTPATIQEITNWDADMIASVFTESYRKKLAFNQRSRQPRDVILAIKRSYENLTPTIIAQNLGITPKQARLMFVPSTLAKIVIDAPWVDPLPKLQAIQRIVRKLTNTYPIPYSLATRLASYTPNEAEARVKTIMRQLDQRPRGVSTGLWMHVVSKYPTPGDTRRDRLINTSLTYWNFLNAFSLNATYHDSDRPLNDQGDMTYAPEQILFEDDGLEEARRQVAQLTAKAGLTTVEVEQLLTHFSADNDPTPEISQLLLRIKRCQNVSS